MDADSSAERPAHHSSEVDSTRTKCYQRSTYTCAGRLGVFLTGHVSHIRKPRSASSAAQPASDSTAAQLVPVIPSEPVLLIVRYVGAHNLETIWTCTECNPYWYNWYCHECRLVNKYLYWSPRSHFGYCGHCCGCCRSAAPGNGEHAWKSEICEACDDLWNLKRTCHTMRDAVKTYNGT